MTLLGSAKPHSQQQGRPKDKLSSTGKVLYTLKTPYRDGTMQVAFDRGGHPSVDFIARLAADSNPAFGEEIFNIAVAEVESKVDPDSIENDIGWESVAFIGVRHQILSILAS